MYDATGKLGYSGKDADGKKSTSAQYICTIT